MRQVARRAGAYSPACTKQFRLFTRQVEKNVCACHALSKLRLNLPHEGPYRFLVAR